jgi:methyltransferase (TIGR00027 family)
MRADEPSVTAVGVALIRATLDRPSSPTGDPDADDALTRSLLGGDRADADRDPDAAHRAVEAAHRGIGRFMVARTTFFDGAVLRALAAGIDQIMIVAAGYDGRALRFRTPGVTFFEVDHPATQADKLARIERLGIATGGITFVAADVTEPDLDATLAAAGHDPDRPTVFLVEGLLRYLPEASFRELPAVLARRAAPGSELALSVVTVHPDETPEAAAARTEQDARMADLGEAVLTVPPRDTALAWFADAGWTVESADDVVDDHDVPTGRLLVLARPSPGAEGIG